MLDFIPGNLGQPGQILCYVHDPDEVLYVCPDITSLSMIFGKILLQLLNKNEIYWKTTRTFIHFFEKYYFYD